MPRGREEKVLHNGLWGKSGVEGVDSPDSVAGPTPAAVPAGVGDVGPSAHLLGILAAASRLGDQCGPCVFGSSPFA